MRIQLIPYLILFWWQCLIHILYGIFCVIEGFFELTILRIWNKLKSLGSNENKRIN